MFWLNTQLWFISAWYSKKKKLIFDQNIMTQKQFLLLIDVTKAILAMWAFLCLFQTQAHWKNNTL